MSVQSCDKFGNRVISGGDAYTLSCHRIEITQATESTSLSEEQPKKRKADEFEHSKITLRFTHLIIIAQMIIIVIKALFTAQLTQREWPCLIHSTMSSTIVMARTRLSSKKTQLDSTSLVSSNAV